MYKRLFHVLFMLLIPTHVLVAQVDITIDPFNQSGAVNNDFKHGIFYVPKTPEAIEDFENNGIEYNAIRLHIIESALNNTTNLNDCLDYLDLAESQLVDISNRCEKVIFIFEKMPVWLSSSSDGSPAQTPGWFVLNTKPPADYTTWNTVVSAIANRIVNGYGIGNAYFEIWNEPDLGSWTATENEYFELFENTYDAIKSVNSAIPVGGPATNYWGNHINWEPPYGYLRNEIADSSLLGNLLDSSAAWNKPLDFVSWHNFHIVHSIQDNILQYINQKCTTLGISLPETIISEWNTPSAVRETAMHPSFFAKNQMEVSKTSTDNSVVAAWQDFDYNTQEFHSNFGLLTYGSIHKPAYKTVLLSDKLDGNYVNYVANDVVDIIATAHTNKLQILVSNYAPDPLIEGLNHLLYKGGYNILQLDSAGFVDIAGNSFTALENIFVGLVDVWPTSPLNIAVNEAMLVYQHYDALQATPRTFNYTINAAGMGMNSVESYVIDATTNNSQTAYDNLILGGLDQAQAITNLTSDQTLESAPISFNGDNFSVTLEPNAVQLIEIEFPMIVGLNEAKEPFLSIYPNPADETLHIDRDMATVACYRIESLHGQLLYEHVSHSKSDQISVERLDPGIYFLRIKDHNIVQQFVVK